MAENEKAEARVKGDTFNCAFPGCPATREDGPLYRVSPKGGPFYGHCEKHKLRIDPEAKALADVFYEKES